MNPNDLLIVGFFASVTFIVKTLVDARVRWKMLRTEVESAQLVRAVLEADEHRRRTGSLRWGIVLTALAVAFGAIQAIGWTEINAGVIALLAGATGLGNLLAFAACQRMSTAPTASATDA